MYLYMYKYITFCIKIVGLNESYSAIQSERNPNKLGLLRLLFELNNFLFVKDIIDNII